MSTTKVLHVIARMNVGGTARYVSELVEAIPNSKLATGFVQGSEVEDPAVELLPVFRIHHLGRKISPIADFKAWRELAKVIREQKPAILHTHTFKAGLIGRLTRGSHKHVHTFHGHLFNDNSFSFIERKVITLIERWLAHRTDVLVSVGLNVGQELRSAGIGVAKEWASIPPGVKELKNYDKSEARELINTTGSGLLIGWMARMTSVKNPYLLLKVAVQLPDLQFVMAGGGDLLDSIKTKAPDNVKVIGWTDAAIFWSAVDIAISTSDNEGMPVALIEAALKGIPIVATKVGSNAEVVKDQVTGFVVSNNEREIAQAIEILIDDVQMRDRLSSAAKERASNLFTLEKMIEKHESCYENLLE